jgi:phage terminase large subunit GpA-like protein
MADGFGDGKLAFRLALSSALRPPSSLSVSEWAEENCVVPSGPHAGPWRNETTPVLVEPMDCGTITHPCRRFTVRGAAQIGKTAVLANWVLYLSDVDPVHMLIAMQSHEKAVSFADKKLTPTIEASPKIRVNYRVERQKSGKASSTLLKRLVSGGVQAVISVLSSKNLQSDSVKYTANDELGEWPDDVDGRGDPVDQLETRQTAFEEVGAKSCYISTAGIEGECKITELFERGDQRWPYLPCPHCGDYSPLKFENMRGPDGETGAHFVQQCCGGIVEHNHKAAMLDGVVYIPCFPSESEDNPAPPLVIPRDEIDRWRARNCEGRQPSFHIWQANSKLVSWNVIWEKWEAAQGKPLRLKAFFQQVKAEPYKVAGDAPDTEKLMLLRRDYKLGRVPVGAYLLTAGVDVQADRLEFAVYGWGPGGSGWLVDKGVIPGDPELPAVWRELQTRVVLAKYEGPHGQLVPVKALAIDTGYKTAKVYAFAARNPGVFAIDGRDGWNMPALGTPVRPKGAPCLLWPVGTYGLKSALYSLLKLTLGGADESGRFAEGAQHFPMACDEAFFEQLTAESLVEIADKRTKRVKRVWAKPNDHTRNEQMDLWVYARAMAEGMPNGGLSSWSYPGPVWDEIIREFGGPPENAQLDLAQVWQPVGAPASGPVETAPAAPKPGKIRLKERD